MKPRYRLSLISCMLAGAACACSADPDRQEADESTSSTAQSQTVVSATGNILIWPAGPIAWNGLVGTWPISVWSTAPIGALAFDTTGVALTGLSLVGSASLAAMPISTPFLNAFIPPAGAAVAPIPPLGPAGLPAPRFGFTGTFNPFVPANPAFGFNAFAPGIGASQATWESGAIVPGLNTWLTPALTSSAMMFTDIASVDAFTPLTFNVSFTVASAAQAGAIQSATTAQALNLANLSIFGTPTTAAALTTGAIPFTSIVFPVLMPLTPVGAVPIRPASLAPL